MRRIGEIPLVRLEQERGRPKLSAGDPRARRVRRRSRRCHRRWTARYSRRSDAPHHHEFKRWIDDHAGFFGVDVLHQIHRPLDVGEQCSDRLALALGGLDLRRDSYRRRRLLVEDWCTALQGGACNLVLDHDTFEGCQVTVAMSTGAALPHRKAALPSRRSQRTRTHRTSRSTTIA
jgi:hypothetical protein